MSKTTGAQFAVIGIGKNSFHVVGHDGRGAIVLRQKCRAVRCLVTDLPITRGDLCPHCRCAREPQRHSCPTRSPRAGPRSGVCFDQRQAAGKALDEALQAISSRYGSGTANFVAMQLEYQELKSRRSAPFGAAQALRSARQTHERIGPAQQTAAPSGSRSAAGGTDAQRPASRYAQRIVS